MAQVTRGDVGGVKVSVAIQFDESSVKDLDESGGFGLHRLLDADFRDDADSSLESIYTSVAKQKAPVMTECEVKSRGRWLPCTIYEALTERDQIMRCRYCHGPVQALKESSNGARAHIEHLQRHPGCRFPVSTFSGVESEHPLALK